MTAKKTKSTDLPSVTSIKGFDHNLACLGFQFAAGKTYTVSGKIKACQQGFHACPTDQHPLSVFEYYAPATSRYFEVVQDGARDADGSKLASASITIGIEISLGDLAARAVKWVFDRADWKNATSVAKDSEGATASGDSGAATASGDSGAATASGSRGAATASGYRGAATASGYSGAATASGSRGAATASGSRGAATASGDSGAATASGKDGRCRGAAGNALFLLHRDQDWKITRVWAGIVGENGIEPNVWYHLDADGIPRQKEA